MRKHKTLEEKVAEQIAKLIVNLDLDIEMVGRYLGKIVGRTAYNRIILIAESAEFERNNNDRLLD